MSASGEQPVQVVALVLLRSRAEEAGQGGRPEPVRVLLRVERPGRCDVLRGVVPVRVLRRVHLLAHVRVAVVVRRDGLENAVKAVHAECGLGLRPPVPVFTFPMESRKERD